MDGPVHKRASRTEEGYVVGVQHPMVLILRKSDLKLISCSRKKIMVYESIYTLPLSLTSSQLAQHLNQEAPMARTIAENAGPTHVQSIKFVSAHTIPPPNTTGTQNFRGPTELDKSAETQTLSSGEGNVVPEHLEYATNLEVGISDMQKRAEKEIADPGIRQKVLNSLKQANDSMMKVVKKGFLKKGKKVDKSNVNVCE
jgi:hypothetical protein